MTPHIQGLFAGQPAPLGGGSRLSSIVKHPVDRLTLTATGPQEDQQADLTVHGGVDKAVHLYPVEHYAALAQAFPAAAAVLGSGFLGENVSLAGLCEDRLRLGDRLVIGDAVLEVSQPRSPCWKIDSRTGEKGVAEHIARQYLTGWYCRVLHPAVIRADSPVCHETVHADWPTLLQLMTLMAEHRPEPARLRAAAVPALTQSWQDKLHKRADWLEQQAG
ncbi:MOSC domain protein [Laribacter hongkongensis HLHK9]|uniref:MOSC domain protein n=1 Tax=Laribacter hongkongensis (strain HLHK9) TaxID=557598 RepID=C1DAG3_LARHH|nr:MOSC domain-containing protein [Laribacter hongkongensis]ACO75278.1 MOSC domain protein [Laribacter hongkongensis HLHK9]